MLASFNTTSGMIDVTYAVPCSASSHRIVYGPLASVAGYGWAGTACNLGATGTAAFDPGSGDAFFVIVANDAVTEGSYGTNGVGSERPEAVGVGGERGGQHLDRYLAPETRVLCPIDLAHSPGPEDGENLVRPEMGAGSERHGVPAILVPDRGNERKRPSGLAHASRRNGRGGRGAAAPESEGRAAALLGRVRDEVEVGDHAPHGSIALVGDDDAMHAVAGHQLGHGRERCPGRAREDTDVHRLPHESAVEGGVVVRRARGVHRNPFRRAVSKRGRPAPGKHPRAA